VTAAAALARLETAGVRLVLRQDGTVGMTAAAQPAADVLAEARLYREAIAALLRQRKAAGRLCRLDPDECATTQSEPALLASGDPTRERKTAGYAAQLVGARRAALMRGVSWADAGAVPPVGAWCYCCNGTHWWGDERGWRCATCHPFQTTPKWKTGE
jgi:hypothetical protein